MKTFDCLFPDLFNIGLIRDSCGIRNFRGLLILLLRLYLILFYSFNLRRCYFYLLNFSTFWRQNFYHYFFYKYFVFPSQVYMFFWRFQISTLLLFYKTTSIGSWRFYFLENFKYKMVSCVWKFDEFVLKLWFHWSFNNFFCAILKLLVQSRILQKWYCLLIFSYYFFFNSFTMENNESLENKTFVWIN